jgi:hypothetical protein
MDGGWTMTRDELLKRLESISLEIDKLDEIIAAKSKENQLSLLQSIKRMENDLKTNIQSIEKVYEGERKTYISKTEDYRYSIAR